MILLKKLLTFICLFVFITGCQQHAIENTDPNQNQVNDTKQGNQKIDKLFATIDNQDFSITLENNKTVDALIEQLPMSITMDDLHGNEKYVYLDYKLPAQSELINYIKAGDFMLFGNDCLVFFYKDFSTSYRYTRLGHVDDVSSFVKKMNQESIQFTIHL